VTAAAPDHLPTAIVIEPRPASGPAVGPRPPRSALARAVELAVWLAIALPALYQIGLLIQAIAGRVGYPYDLEWMEGGMLHHALRIRHGDGIYVAPNVDFIPYLYTPLYPTLLALFSGLVGGPFGPSYLLGRVISIAGLVGIAAIAFASFAPAREHRLQAAVGAVLGLGLFAACYPYVEGWYDVVRADTFFLFMVTAGIAGLPAWALRDDGIVGHGKVAAGAALMALAFFCKQTGIFYVALGGAIVVVLNWRRAPTYAAMAGLIGLGGSWVLDRSTHGWFWTYVSEIHRAHDFNMDRVYASFGNILWHFPAPTIVIATALPIVFVTAIRARGIPPAAQPFVVWSAAFAVSTVVGAIGWGTEFAHFNAYMPALLHGALAAGAAVPALIGCVARLGRGQRGTGAIATGLGIVARARRHLRPRALAAAALHPDRGRRRRRRPADPAPQVDRRRYLDAIAPVVPRARRQDAARPPDGDQGRHDPADPHDRRARRQAARSRVRGDRARQPRSAIRAARDPALLPAGVRAAGRRAAPVVHRGERGPRRDLDPGDPGDPAARRQGRVRLRGRDLDRRLDLVGRGVGPRAGRRGAARPGARARRDRRPVRDQHERRRRRDRPGHLAAVRARRQTADPPARRRR
jgi:hypothetical protein